MVLTGAPALPRILARLLTGEFVARRCTDVEKPSALGIAVLIGWRPICAQ